MSVNPHLTPAQLALRIEAHVRTIIPAGQTITEHEITAFALEAATSLFLDAGDPPTVRLKAVRGAIKSLQWVPDAAVSDPDQLAVCVTMGRLDLIDKVFTVFKNNAPAAQKLSDDALRRGATHFVSSVLSAEGKERVSWETVSTYFARANKGEYSKHGFTTPRPARALPLQIDSPGLAIAMATAGINHHRNMESPQ